MGSNLNLENSVAEPEPGAVEPPYFAGAGAGAKSGATAGAGTGAAPKSNGSATLHRINTTTFLKISKEFSGCYGIIQMGF